ncbi:hypothetical protein [Novosphingobium sp. 11B]
MIAAPSAFLALVLLASVALYYGFEHPPSAGTTAARRPQAGRTVKRPSIKSSRTSLARNRLNAQETMFCAKISSA